MAGQQENSNENKKVQPRLADATHDYLDDLVLTGLYGTTKTQVAQRLIEMGIMEAIAKGHIAVRRVHTDEKGRK